MGNYWSRTDDYLDEHGAPTCPYCGKEMFAEDDHGRFACFCQGIGRTTLDCTTGQVLPVSVIPQIDTAGMTDEEKAQIPGINRLDDTPTEAEAQWFQIFLSGGVDAIGTPEYEAACKAIEDEQKGS